MINSGLLNLLNFYNPPKISINSKRNLFAKTIQTIIVFLSNTISNNTMKPILYIQQISYDAYLKEQYVESSKYKMKERVSYFINYEILLFLV